jgi:glycosyltransferase involved in cell wall biosynthesis
MRILIAANLTPFLQGGAQEHIRGLTQAFREAGHSVECLQLPFAFNPVTEVKRAMDWAESLSMAAPSGQTIDRLIGLQFPAYGVQHPHAVGWVMHQHRAVYELYEPSQAAANLKALREQVHDFDKRCLAPLANAGRLFANSARVAERLNQFNSLKAEPLYHPPPLAERFYCEPAQPYFFFPSRFESLKRQILAIEGFAQLPAGLSLVLAGEGGQLDAAKALAARLDLQDRVHFLGRISQAEKLAWTANALAVVYPPRDEDYGYVTLEAMLAAKPVITCKDSGGPLEFVVHEETGLVAEPTAEGLAQAMAGLAGNAPKAQAMGKAGLARYQGMGIGWPAVVDRLLAA